LKEKPRGKKKDQGGKTDQQVFKAKRPNIDKRKKKPNKQICNGGSVEERQKVKL